VFGGLTFGGGPIANYMSHAVVSMVQRLREERGNGFLFANGGFATDNHCIVIASQPIAAARFPQNFDYQAEADAAREAVPVLNKDCVGPAMIESYTVFHDREGQPASGVVVARTADGERTLCYINVQNPEMLAFFVAGQIEPVGKRGHLAVQDGIRTWTNA
jgi:acetyl-CoA C-acetyltransferase